MQQTLDEQELWKRVKDDLQIDLAHTQFNLWIRPSKISTLEEIGDECKLTITSNSPYHVQMLESQFKEAIEGALSRIGKKKYSLTFAYVSKKASANVVALQDNQAQQPSSPTGQEIQQLQSSQQPSQQQTHKQSFQSSENNAPLFQPQPPQQSVSPASMAIRQAGLRDDYTFETFAVSSSNEMAHAAAIAVSQNPGKAYNPLFLYGGVGVGKTHLMHAIGINMIRQDPNTPILYITGEEFTNSIVSAIQQKKTIQLKQKFRAYKALLVDDIQFIAGKEGVQEEFFHTFNAIAPSGGQIIMTSDRPPSEINPLEDRLRSRFEAGLIIDIQQPTFELRTAITLIKAERVGLPLPMDVAQAIAMSIDNARKIEGVLAKLHSEHFLFKKTINLELAQSIIGTIEGNRGEIAVSIKENSKPTDVIRAVCSYFKITPKHLKGSSRVKTIVYPRHLTMYLLHQELNVTLEEIGMMFDGRDHTSVIHAVEKIKTSLLENEETRKTLQLIRQSLLGGDQASFNS